MDLVPEKQDGAVVFNIANLCTSQNENCRDCSEIGGSLHNWLVTTSIRYVLVDLQDEKDICPTFLVELLQLRRRHRVPFLFAGVMARPLRTLQSYDYTKAGAPVFTTPDEAIAYLRENFPALLVIDESTVKWGEQILSFRSRQALNRTADGADDAGEDEAEEADD